MEPAIPNAAHRLSYGQTDVAEKILGSKFENSVTPSRCVKHNATALKTLRRDTLSSKELDSVRVSGVRILHLYSASARCSVITE